MKKIVKGKLRPEEHHGLSRTKLYRTWIAMKTRCENPNTPYYSNYGGRGIKVCKEWSNSFIAFYNYIGNKPSEKHSLDRIDNDGNYAPGNVRWAISQEQTRNQRARKNKACRFKGVRIHKNRNKRFQATITLNYKTISLGYYLTAKEASEIYNKAAKQYFGEFAVLNKDLK